MEYLAFIAAIIILPLVLLLHYNKKLRELAIQKILERNLLREQNKNLWYSSLSVGKAAKALNKLSKKQLQPLFAELKNGKLNLLLRQLDEETADEIKVIKGQGKKIASLLQKAEKAMLDIRTAEAAKIIELISPRNKMEKARTNYIQSCLALLEGDLLSASQKATDAAKFFQKHNMLYEEAQTYLLSGTIYRVSAVTDTADFMLRTAAEIFAAIGANAKQAEAYGHLGMLMVMQERFAEAYDYFGKAQNLFQYAKDMNGYAEILNQQALTDLINNESQKAAKTAAKAEKIFKDLNDARGQAMSLDIEAQIAFGLAQWKKAASKAAAAHKLYEQTDNRPAKLEMELLLAQIDFETAKTAAAEKRLRKIIDEDKSCKSCFHIANAYNLLGIIYLRQGDLRRAEGIFQQSLSAELQNERWYGAAIDYANIALTSYRRGNKDTGDKNREMAIKCAQDAGAENLAKMLKQRLN